MGPVEKVHEYKTVVVGLANGVATLSIGGVDLSKHVRKATVTIEAGDRATVTLELEPRSLDIELEGARIRIAPSPRHRT